MRFSKLFSILIVTVFVLTTGLALAEETAVANDAQQEVALDENVQAQDLGVSEPTILPNSPFYFLKNLTRGLQSAITFNPIAKAELKLKFSNEKIIEAKKLAERTANPEILTKALENYKAEINSLKTTADRIKGNTQDAKVNKFLDKLIDQNIKQQKLLGKLEKDLPSQVFEMIKEVKEKNLSNFSELVAKIAETPEILEQKITKATESQAGSQFKNFKNLEVLLTLEEKLPQKAQDAIKKATANALNRLQSDLTQMSAQDQEKFKNYIQNIGGNEIRHLEILDNLEGSEDATDETRSQLQKIREITVERVGKKIDNLTDAQKESFLKPLEAGSIEKIRIVKDLEDNLGSKFAPRMIEIKNKALNNFRERLEGAQTPELKEKIINEAKERAGVKTLEVLKEFENVVSPEKKETFLKMKEGATQEINSRLKDASEKSLSQIKKAEEMIGEASKLVTSGVPQSAIALLQAAKKHLENAKLAQAQEKYGEAFGQATSALNNAENALRAIKKTELKEVICAQVVTPAVGPEGNCKTFPTPCEVPEGWKKTDSCAPTDPLQPSLAPKPIMPEKK